MYFEAPVLLERGKHALTGLKLVGTFIHIETMMAGYAFRNSS